MTHSAMAGAQSLEALIQSLVNTHNKIVAAAQDVTEAQYYLKEQRGGWLPKVELTISEGEEHQINPGGDETRLRFSEHDVKITQLLFDFGKTPAAVKGATVRLLKAQAQLDKTRSTLLLEGASAYFDLLRMAKRLEYARQSEDNIRKQTGMEESKVKLGGGLPTDVLQTKAQLSGAKAARIRAEGDLENARSKFWLVFGEEPAANIASYPYPIIPKHTLPKSLNSAIERAMGLNLEIKLAKLDVELAFEKSREKRSAMLPKLELVGDYKRDDNVAGLEGIKEDTQAKVELTYPIFNGFKDQSAYKAALSAVGSAESKLHDQEREINLKIRNAWQNLHTQLENTLYLKEQADIAGAFLENARKERKLGNRSLLDVLSGETRHFEANSAAYSAKVDADIAVFRLLDALGDLNPELIRTGR